jgi:enoyl-[acyl-carrier protein] reductase II
MSALLDILGSRHPIIQGPVGALNDPTFVAVVCEAGAFGMLALGFASDMDEVKRMVEDVKSRTNKPFGANLMLMNPKNAEILEVLAKAGVKTVTTSTGSPKSIYPVLHGLGMKGLHVLLSVAHAKRAEEAGADGLVVSGSESGGLRSTGPELSTMVLIPAVVDAVGIPVVAAGGIADSRGYRAALALGAQGVQLGTRLIASKESPANEEWKKAIVAGGDGDVTHLPLGKMRMSVLFNDKLRAEMGTPGADLSTVYNLMNAPKAWTTGDFSLFPAGGGQVCALIRDIRPVKAIIEEMVS